MNHHFLLLATEREI